MNNTSSGRVPLFFRINMEGDTITSLSWAADSLTLIGSSESSREAISFECVRKKQWEKICLSSGFKYELIELKKDDLIHITVELFKVGSIDGILIAHYCYWV